MAKELPYFKFEPSEWSSGMIQVCSYESRGLFLEMCCLYWSRLGDLPYALALQKLCAGNASLLEQLESNDIYKIEYGKIVIGFLDEQLNQFKDASSKARNAANKRWSNADAMRSHKKVSLFVVLHKKSPYGKRLKSATIATSTPIVSIILRFISESFLDF